MEIFYTRCFLRQSLFNLIKIKQVKFNLRINQAGVYSQAHPNGTFFMTGAAANFIKPLLQCLFDQVTVSTVLPENVFDLDKFRKLKLSFASGDIRQWYYNLVPEHLPQAFEKPLFTLNKSERYADKVMFIHTERYCNYFVNYDYLAKYRDDLVFIGLPAEYQSFSEEHFDLEYCQLSDAKECAELMLGARGVIGNPSGLYAIAESLKVPRVLISPEYMVYRDGNVCGGPVNVHPRGGWFEVAQTQEKFKNAVDNLMHL